MKDILIILAAIVVPIVALYLAFAFVAWDLMKKRNRYETENPQSPPTALLR